MKYKHKPFEVEALRYTGKNDKEIEAFSGFKVKYDMMGGARLMNRPYGGESMSVGDYVVLELPRTSGITGVVNKEDFEKYWEDVD